MSALGKRNRPVAGHDGAAIKSGDLEGSQGTYSSIPAKATFDQVRMKHRMYRSIEKLRRRKQKGEATHPFRVELLRLREVEALIRYRHGPSLEETDDDFYFRSVAHAIQAHGSERVFGLLCDWCHRWAHWALSERYLPMLREVTDSVAGRTHDLRADACAQLLCVTMKERLALGLRTIGACDVTPAERKQLMREKKMESDRQRRRAEREIAGRKGRQEYERNSLSNRRPWDAAGMSRAAWYRLPKEARETSLSRIEDSIWIGDTPVSGGCKARSPAAIAAPCRPKDRLPQHANGTGRRAAKPKAKQSEAEGQRERMRASPALIATLAAALNEIFGPIQRRNKMPGSATIPTAA